MKYYPVIIVLIVLFFSQCKNSIELSKRQVLTTEKEFEKLAFQKGLAVAFYEFADDSAVIQREENIIKGKDAIRAFYQKSLLRNVSLKWNAESVYVANSADLAFTYGRYTFKAIDLNDESVESKGIFNTVWKKQSDGSWRFVWD